MFRSSKTFTGFPCAHRRWAHEGHCKLVHGYSRSFKLWFGCSERTQDTGFVMDFGDLKRVRAWLAERYDHTLLIDAKDPLLEQFESLEEAGACKLIVLDDVGMEGTAEYVFRYIDHFIRTHTRGRVWVESVEVRENEHNSAIVDRVAAHREWLRMRRSDELLSDPPQACRYGSV